MSVKFKDNRAKVKRQMRVDLARGQNRAMDFLVKNAKQLAPVRTGFLKRMIRRRLIATPERSRASAESAAKYSGYVNNGTYKMAANPFWTVALLRMYVKFGEFFKK